MSEDPSLSDPLKFTTIAHAGHRYYGPVSPARAASLIALLPLEPNDAVLDIGCGRAHFLLELLLAHPARGVGVDSNAAFIERAEVEATRLALGHRVELIAQPLRETVPADGTWAAIVCMGSSQAVGTLEDALRWAYQALRPGGVALFADGYWRQLPPPKEYLQVLDAAADEIQTHAGNAALARDAGFHVLRTMASNDDEWDEYEGRYCEAVERYVDAHPEDPDTQAMARRIRAWHEAYLRWGRATLGYGFYLLLKPSQR